MLRKVVALTTASTVADWSGERNQSSCRGTGGDDDLSMIHRYRSSGARTQPEPCRRDRKRGECNRDPGARVRTPVDPDTSSSCLLDHDDVGDAADDEEVAGEG